LEADALAGLKLLASEGQTTMTLNEDLIVGARRLAMEICGSDTLSARRRIYHLHKHGVIPTFRLGGQIAATRSGLREHFDRKMQLASAA